MRTPAFRSTWVLVAFQFGALSGAWNTDDRRRDETILEHVIDTVLLRCLVGGLG